MDQGTRDIVTWVLATTISLCVVVGLAVRYVLMPYLREHLIEPVKQVKKQVTENHHHNEQPTVLDRLDDVSSQVRDLSSEVREMQRGYTALAGALGTHLNFSEAEVSRIWQAIGRKQNAPSTSERTQS